MDGAELLQELGGCFTEENGNQDCPQKLELALEFGIERDPSGLLRSLPISTWHFFLRFAAS